MLHYTAMIYWIHRMSRPYQGPGSHTVGTGMTTRTVRSLIDIPTSFKPEDRGIWVTGLSGAGGNTARLCSVSRLSWPPRSSPPIGFLLNHRQADSRGVVIVSMCCAACLSSLTYPSHKAVWLGCCGGDWWCIFGAGCWLLSLLFWLNLYSVSDGE
jgi:hypothetical protein